jgi:hypothetical protein
MTDANGSTSPSWKVMASQVEPQIHIVDRYKKLFKGVIADSLLAIKSAIKSAIKLNK